VSTPPKLTVEQYLAFVAKPLENILSSPTRAVVVTQQEKDTLLATIAARKVVDFTGTIQFLFKLNLPFMLSPTVSKLIKCPLCHKGIKEPKTLPCLHSFCQKCLEKHECDLREKPRCEVCKAPQRGSEDPHCQCVH